MKYLIVLLILFLPSCSEAREYVFLPNPGAWHGNQYENKHILFVDGVSYCKSDIGKPLDQVQCDYWQKITWHKGKIDRNEGIVIGVKLASGLFDAYTSAGAIGRGCEEIGSFGLLGKSPSLPAYIGYQLVMAAPFVYVAHHTPLAYSSAKYMIGPAGYFAFGSIRAGNHALGCHR